MQAILANLRSENVELFAAHEPELIPVLAPLTVRETGIAMTQWAANAAAVVDRPEPVEPEQHVRLNTTLNGPWQLTGTLNADTGSIVEAGVTFGSARHERSHCPFCKYYHHHQ